VRLRAALCGALLVCLFGASTAEARSRHARAHLHKWCGSKAVACHARSRLATMVRQAPYFVRVHRLVHRHPPAWLERSRPDPLREIDDAALQDRTVAGGGDDLRLHASLEPVGVPIERPCVAITSGVVTRHSPRGPPLSPLVA